MVGNKIKLIRSDGTFDWSVRTGDIPAHAVFVETTYQRVVPSMLKGKAGDSCFFNILQKQLWEFIIIFARNI